MNWPHIDKINLKNLEKGVVHKFWFDLMSGPFGEQIALPIIIARGTSEGPNLGITAVVHGDELNGIPVIQRFMEELDVKNLKGNIIAVLVVNIPSFLRKRRRFIDGVDLNHIFPGKKNGAVSQVYAYRFVKKILKHFNFLIDIHTASVGRINSHYIRVDMENEATKRMALLQHPQIIVHNPPSDGTLRGAAAEMNIPAITVEAGNPNVYQRGMIKSSTLGLHNVARDLKMIEGDISETDIEPIICEHSYWIYTKHGGMLNVFPDIVQIIEKDELIARQRDIFGDAKFEYKAPEDGVVIGKSVSPVNHTGGRILHLGILRK